MKIKMSLFYKLPLLAVSALLITNCGANTMKAQSAANKTEATAATGSTNTTASNGTISEPLVAPDSLLKASDIPNDILDVITKAPTAGGNSILQNFMAGAGCNLLTTALSVGASYFLGPIAGYVVPLLSNLIFKCGTTSSSLLSLIPGGSSQSTQIFTVVSQVLQAVTQGQSPMTIINGLKNPQDVSAILNIVDELIAKTGDSKLQEVSSLITGFMDNYGSSIGMCGSMNTISCEVFTLVNKVRTDKGLQALLPNEKCIAAAQAHSKDMFTNLLLSHSSSDGETVQQRMADYGILGAWAENIVKGSSLTPADAVQMWMNSPGHAQNILNSTFTSGGVGFINGYFTQCLAN